jgi:hypothetical protein
LAKACIAASQPGVAPGKPSDRHPWILSLRFRMRQARFALKSGWRFQ